MSINENTIIRVKVPKHLYESVKAQLTLGEGKSDYGMPGSKTIKEKKTGDGPKKSSAPKDKKPAAPKSEKAKAPEKEAKAPHDGMKKAKAPEKKERTLDELKKIHEMLGERIAEMEGSHKKEELSESIMDAKSAVPIIRDALAKGQSVEINGEKVAKIVPMAAAISTDSQKVYRLPQLEDLSVITIDGEPITGLIASKSSAAAMPKPEPKPVDPEAEKAWMKRFGPGGGYETAAGFYTGD